ncbi:hypothetical protein chiPu_0004170 [Chiloscyllium punctatum]|uniref:Uncharacterized protein n=1 Tax=Chiloscyllium punctatum TaxID=137246 RepID=A0A401S5U9_CHIPU|nr:hypothetical protein [Chiloscyllium punctatum]
MSSSLECCDPIPVPAPQTSLSKVITVTTAGSVLTDGGGKRDRPLDPVLSSGTGGHSLWCMTEMPRLTNTSCLNTCSDLRVISSSGYSRTLTVRLNGRGRAVIPSRTAPHPFPCETQSLIPPPPHLSPGAELSETAASPPGFCGGAQHSGLGGLAGLAAGEALGHLEQGSSRALCQHQTQGHGNLSQQAARGKQQRRAPPAPTSTASTTCRHDGYS